MSARGCYIQVSMELMKVCPCQRVLCTGFNGVNECQRVLCTGFNGVNECVSMSEGVMYRLQMRPYIRELSYRLQSSI